MRCAAAIYVLFLPAPGPRSRARRSPRRSAGADPPRRAPCRRRARRLEGEVGHLGADLLDRTAPSPPRSACACPRGAAGARPPPPPWRARAGPRRPCAPRRGSRADSFRAWPSSARFCSSSCARLVAGVVGLVDRLADAVTPLVDRLLDRAERVLPKHEERDREAISVQIMRPGTTSISPLAFPSVARSLRDQRQHRFRRGRRRAGRRSGRRTRRPR